MTESNEEFFGVCPILGCWTSQEVADAIQFLMEDEESKLKIGKDSIEWIKDYHSPERVADIQISAYRKSLQ